ncbi:MAG: tRNA uridine-5-carboxymethylaminomethyl(34) synthesis GTPase MnmE, partial [Acetobacteraceae bacterium]|nr:tRNA uridine-5-carboxymethylaminomethyl(34) synthesis GTPase MnmE [Acetobacteraceae bacterium]
FAETFFAGQESGLVTRERQRACLQEAAEALRRSTNVIADGEELAAEELRRAAYSLGRLLGRVDVEDILDVIFREFCIGK